MIWAWRPLRYRGGSRLFLRGAFLHAWVGVVSEASAPITALVRHFTPASLPFAIRSRQVTDGRVIVS